MSLDVCLIYRQATSLDVCYGTHTCILYHVDCAGVGATLVFYAPPHALAAVLADMADALGSQRRCVVARELTKVGGLLSCLLATHTFGAQMPSRCTGMGVGLLMQTLSCRSTRSSSGAQWRRPLQSLLPEHARYVPCMLVLRCPVPCLSVVVRAAWVSTLFKKNCALCRGR